ncbi:MAG: hypothetical protein ACTHM6_11910 [Tepidisphaeraceae bacterium]
MPLSSSGIRFTEVTGVKHATLSILCLAAVCIGSGCASQPSADSSANAVPQHEYRPVAAAALAFDPPIASQTPAPDLSREGRSLAAFAGYEQSVTSFSYVHQRDDQRFDNGRFQRTAYSDTTSVLSR